MRIRQMKLAYVLWRSLLRCVAGLLDIPAHKSRIQSLHLLFTLFSEFKNSQVCYRQHFFLIRISNVFTA